MEGWAVVHNITKISTSITHLQKMTGKLFKVAAEITPLLSTMKSCHFFKVAKQK